MDIFPGQFTYLPSETLDLMGHLIDYPMTDLTSLELRDNSFMEDFFEESGPLYIAKNGCRPEVEESSFECISDSVEGKTCRCNQFVKTTALLTEHVDKKSSQSRLCFQSWFLDISVQIFCLFLIIWVKL